MSRKLFARVALPTLTSFGLLVSSATPASALEVKNNVPRAIQQAVDLGPVDTGKEMNITVHLKVPNKAAFDAAVADLYNPASPHYEHWMTNDDLKTYAPPAGQMAIVQKELEKNGLKVISVDPLGFSIRVHGTAANVQKAFQTELRQYSLNEKTFRAHVQEARLTGEADTYVESVGGLDGGVARPMLKRAVNFRTGKAPANLVVGKDAAAGDPILNHITANCFKPPKQFGNPGAPLPVGIYSGNDYDDTFDGSIQKTCSFTPADLQAHYGLPAVYAKGIDGKGQTIVLVEGYGYPTIESDANIFSSITGLPKLTASNFKVIYPEGMPADPNAGILLGWDVEIALDVQWSHSIAPNAKIVVLAAAGQDSEDFQDAISYAVAHDLGNVLSNSWEEDTDIVAGPLEIASFDAVFKKAAAKGISVNVSSGDGGDSGLGSPIGAPGVPSESPYATAVGGTAILKNIDGSNLEVGWGNAEALVGTWPSGPLDPPIGSGFLGGGGGGESINIAKPSWQSALPGLGRQVPDVSALSDPFTGVFIILTDPASGNVFFEPGYGGTSLGCPIFSAFWALANQSAGHALGQAAPKIAAATGKQMLDILPVSSPGNISGTLTDAAGTTKYSSADLLESELFPAMPLPSHFVTAMWPLYEYTPAGDVAEVLFLVQSFGTDSSLTVAKGWDNVTGFGVPNGLTFVQGFK